MNCQYYWSGKFSQANLVKSEIQNYQDENLHFIHYGLEFNRRTYVQNELFLLSKIKSDTIPMQGIIATAAQFPDDCHRPPQALARSSICLPTALTPAPASWMLSPSWFFLKIVRRSDKEPGFEVQTRRRALSAPYDWMTRWKRLVRDYEQRIDASEARIRIALSRPMPRRMVPP